jgi:hypothetical protein
VEATTLEQELAEAEKALASLRGEMDAAVDKQGGVRRDQAEEFVRRMEAIKDRITFLKKALAARS